MAKFDYGRQITYGINFNIDKSALNALQTELQQIQKMGFTTMQLKMDTADIDKVRQVYNDLKSDANQLQNILEKSFNSNLGTFNLRELNTELNKLDLNKIQKDFNAIGATGANAFRKIETSIITQNAALKQSNEFLDKMATTFKNTVRYGISSSIFNNLTNSIQKAYEYTVKLDSSLNDIRIVTDKSAESMNQFALQANKAAQGLGKSTRDYTEASLIYYQQGLNDEETAARTETTLKAANVTGQSTAQVSEQLTAVWNGYKVSAAETELYVDKLAATAATTAADLEELSVGMSKVASAANIMGVDVDQLNAQLATIVSVTREAPESIGTSLKTIYARMSDIEAGLDGETSLGKYTADMADMGINVLDTNGKLRDMGDVIEEIGGKWSSMSREQQVALAQTVAGTRQYSRLMSLFDNWGMYNEALETSRNSMGTLQHQQDIYMESTQAHLQQLNTAWERVYNSMINKESVVGLTDGLTAVVKLLAEFTESIGGGIGLLNMLGSTAARVFSTQIARGLVTLDHNIQAILDNAKNNEFAKSITDQFTNIKTDDAIQQQVNGWLEQYGQYSHLLDAEQKQAYQQLIQQGVELANEKALWDEQRTSAEKYFDTISEGKFAFEDLKESGLSDELEKLVRNEKAFAEETLTVLDEFDRFDENGNFKDQLDTIKANLEHLHPVTEKAKKDIEEAKKALANFSDYNLITKTDQEAPLSGALKSAKDGVRQVIIDAQGAKVAIQREMDDIGDSAGQSLQVVTDKIAAAGEDFKKIDVTQTVVNMAGAFGQLASAVSMVPRLSDIWSNDNLSTGEKLLQTVTSLASIFAMWRAGVSGLIKTIGELTVANAAHTAGEVADTAATTASTVATKANTAAINSNKVALLSHPIGILLTVISAVLGGVLLLNQAIANNTKAQIENNKESIKTENKKQEEIKTNQALLKSFQDLNEQYENGTATSKALDEAIDNIINNYDNFVDSIGGVISTNGELVDSNGDVLKGLDLTSLKANQAAKNYDALTESILQAEKAEAEAGLKSAKTELDAAGDNVVKTAKQGNGFEFNDDYTITSQSLLDYNWWEYLIPGAYGMKSAGWDMNKSKNDKAFEILQKNISGNTNVGKLATGGYAISAGSNTPEDIVNLYNNIDAALSEMKVDTEAKKSDLYKELDEWRKKMAEDETIQTYREAVKDTEEYAKEVNALNIKSKNLAGEYNNKSYEEIQQSVVDQLKEMDAFKNKTDEELKAIADIQLKGISNEIDTLQSNYILIQSLLKDRNWSEEDIQKLNNTVSKGDVNTAQLGQLQTAISSDAISEEDKNRLLELLKSGDLTTFRQELEKANDTIRVSTASMGQAISQYEALEKARKAADSEATLAAEDYEKLSNKIQSYYTLMADGTYKMTGDAEEFYNLVTGQEQQNFRDIIAKAANDQESVSTTDFRNAQTGLASTASSKDELASMMNRGEITSEDYRDNYKRVRDSEAKSLDLDPEVIDTYSEKLRKTNKNIQDIEESLKDTNGEIDESKQLNFEEYLDDIYVAQKRLERGSKKVSDSLDDWKEALKDSTSPEYADAIEEMKDAVADLTNSSADYISLDTVENLDRIQRAAQGDTQALWELQRAVAQDYLVSLGIDFNDGEVANAMNQINSYIDSLRPEDLEVGAVLKDDNFINGLNSLAQATNMTADQMAQYLGNMGMDADITTTTKELDSIMYVPSTTYDIQTNSDGVMTGMIPHVNIEKHPYKQEVQVAAIQTIANGGSGIRVVSGGKISGGSAKSGYGSGAKGKGKGGGGGGGGGSSKKADTMDPLKEEIDRYHDVNVKLEQIETTLGRLEDAEDKAFGGDLVKNYNKQIEALNNQITVTQQKLGIAADEMKELQGKLSGSGVRFNSDGTIGNYAAALKAQEDYVNGIINHYNSLGADAQESYKETVEQAKENFDKFKENLERYDELVTDEIPDLQNQIQEAIDKITEKNIEKFKMEVDLRLDMAEAERDWNEFKKKVIDQIDDDDILGNAKARIEDLRTYLNDLDTGEVQALGKHVQETLDELRAFDKGLDNVYGRERAQSLEDLEEYFDNLKDALEEIVEIQDELQEDVLDQMDAVQDKIDDQVDTFEAISDLIEHDMTLIQLTLGEDAYAELSNFYKAQQDNYNKQLDFQRQQVDYWKQQMDAVEQGSEQFDAAREKWADAVADWNDLVENTIENLQDQLENTINAIFKNLNDNLTNNKGLQYISDEFEIVGERAEQFLDEINRLQGIADLADKYQDAINNTDNVSAQRKLNAAMEEQLNALKDADKLSEKDIERAQKRYDLTVAQIALEEAQAQKNTLRLRRDTQGNYRYQYVADDEAVNDAENKLREAYNSLYNFDKERYIDNLNEAYDTWNDYQEAMAEAAQINDPELRAEKEALIQQEYGEIINGIVEQNEKIRTDLRESAFMDLANLKQEEYDTYMNMTQAEQDVILNNLIPQWDDGIQQMISSIKDEGGFEPTTTEAFDNIKQAAEDYDAAVQDIQEDINATVGDVLDGEDKIIAINQDLTVSNNDVVDSYKAELTAVQELAAGVNDLADAYKDELQAAKDAHDYLAKQREAAAKAAAEAEKGKTAAKETVATPLPETKPAQTTAAPAPAQNSNPRAGYRLGGQSYTIRSGDTLSGIAQRFYGRASLWTEIWAHNKGNLRSGNANRIYPGEIVYLDTGGYTGEWNNSGKLGVLHQKELVLNAKDTKNLLDTVAIMRNITAAVGENTLQRLSGATSGSYIANGDGKGILEQDVHITANFPNVRSAIEIETALNNLTNAASQYIGKQ